MGKSCNGGEIRNSLALTHLFRFQKSLSGEIAITKQLKTLPFGFVACAAAILRSLILYFLWVRVCVCLHVFEYRFYCPSLNETAIRFTILILCASS